jgi:hypothetical protein
MTFCSFFYEDGDRSFVIFKEKYQLTMSYFDNFDNELINKYKKNLKNRKKFIDVFFYF